MLMFVGLASHQTQAYSITDGEAEIPGSIECSAPTNSDLSDLLLPLLKNMGVEVEDLVVVETEIAESCTVRIRGTYNGTEIDVTITFEGISCAELLKQLM